VDAIPQDTGAIMTNRNQLSSLLSVLTICACGTLSAEDPPVELPREGAWARYHVVDDDVAFKILIKVLGSEQRIGKMCRWIEIQETIEDNKETWRFLIPVESLLKSERPLEDAVAAQWLDGDDKLFSESLDSIGFYGRFLLFLPAMRKNAKTVNVPQTVEYQAGKLTIPSGQQGVYAWENPNTKFTFEYTVWSDPKVPLGMVRKSMKFTLALKGRDPLIRTIEETLEDCGFDAQPTLPK
jgi:hypothetical protein